MDNNAASFVGNIPEFYDRGLGPVLFAGYAAEMAARVATLAPARVLETAAGTGIVTRALRDRLSGNAELVATDLNLPMLDVAKTKFGPAERVAFQSADAQALPFPDSSFDAVVCQFGIMFFPDKPLSLREARRVLTPGGRYLFSVWDSHRYNGFARLTDALIRRTFAENPPAFYSVPFSCAEIDPLKLALLEAGFDQIEIAVRHVEQPVADLPLFVRGLVFGNPLVDQIRARGGSPDAIYEQLLGELGREFGTNPTTMPLQTIFYSAIKPH